MEDYTETKELKIKLAYSNSKICDLYNENYIPNFNVIKSRTNENIVVTYGVFSGSEPYVQINNIEKYNLCNSHVYVRAYINKPHEILYLIQLEDILLNAGAILDLEIPYLPFARQDRYCSDGQSFSLKIFVDMLKINKAEYGQRNSITMWDVHSKVSIDLLSKTGYLNIINIGAITFIKRCHELYNELLTNNNLVLVCPDKGAYTRTLELQSFLNKTRKNSLDVIFCDKKRDPKNGKILGMEIIGNENLNGLTCFISDDICDGGATFIDLSEKLKLAGASSVILYVTHGIFSKGFTDLNKNIDHIYTTESKRKHRVSDNNRLTIINCS